jgi:hypothetical protein
MTSLSKKYKLLDGRRLLIKQDFSGELGGTVWDASIVLCRFLETHPRFHFQQQKVLELGAGIVDTDMEEPA